MKILHTHIIYLITEQFIRKHILRLANHHFIGLWPNLCHKYRMSQSQLQAFPLANGIVGNPLMSAQHLSVRRHKISRPRNRILCFSVNKPCIIIVRNKADFLTVRFCSHRQTIGPGHSAHRFFIICSQRHQRVGELLLCQLIQCIGLILCRPRHTQCIPAIGKPHNLPVMSCGNIIRADGKRTCQQCFPFYITVAGNAGIGRPAPEIFPDKILCHR